MLSKTAEYALRVVACLAEESDQSLSADRIARRTKVPRRYLQKVLQDLVLAGLVGSRPGPGGGYALARTASGISLLDVVNAVDPLERIRHCPLGLPGHTELCPLHREIDKAYEATEKAFARVSIAQINRSKPTRGPLCEVHRNMRKTIATAASS